MITAIYLRVNKDKGYVLPPIILALFMVVTFFYFLHGVALIYMKNQRFQRRIENSRDNHQFKHYRQAYENTDRQHVPRNPEETEPRHRGPILQDLTVMPRSNLLTHERQNDRSMGSLCDLSAIPARMASREKMDVSGFANDILKELEAATLPTVTRPAGAGGLRSGFISPQKQDYRVELPDTNEKDYRLTESGKNYSEAPTGKSSVGKVGFNFRDIAQTNSDKQRTGVLANRDDIYSRRMMQKR